MNLWDFLLIGLIVLSSLWGYMRGLVMMVGSLVVAAFAGFFALMAAEYLTGLLGSVDPLVGGRLATVSYWLVFLTLFVLGQIVLRMINLLTNVPIVGSLKRWGGMALGLIQGVLLAGIVTMLALQYPIMEGQQAVMEASQLAPLVLNAVAFLLPLISSGYREATERITGR